MQSIFILIHNTDINLNVENKEELLNEPHSFMPLCQIPTGEYLSKEAITFEDDKVKVHFFKTTTQVATKNIVTLTKRIENKKSSSFFNSIEIQFETYENQSNEPQEPKIWNASINLEAENIVILYFFLASHYTNDQVFDFILKVNNPIEKLTHEQSNTFFSFFNHNENKKNQKDIRDKKIYEWCTDLENSHFKKIDYLEILRSGVLTHKVSVEVNMCKLFQNPETNSFDTTIFRVSVKNPPQEEKNKIKSFTLSRPKDGELQAWYFNDIIFETPSKQNLNIKYNTKNENNYREYIDTYYFQLKFKKYSVKEIKALSSSTTGRGIVAFVPFKKETKIKLILLPDWYKTFGFENKIDIENDKIILSEYNHISINDSKKGMLKEWENSLSEKNFYFMRYTLYNPRTTLSSKIKTELSMLDETWKDKINNDLIDLLIMNHSDLAILADIPIKMSNARKKLINIIEENNYIFRNREELTNLKKIFYIN